MDEPGIFALNGAILSTNNTYPLLLLRFRPGEHYFGALSYRWTGENIGLILGNFNNKTGGNHMKKCILVVDDDSMNLTRTQMILGKEYVVLTEESGMDALTRLKSTKVDMVLLDIDMPGMNGIETFERMKILSLRSCDLFDGVGAGGGCRQCYQAGRG